MDENGRKGNKGARYGVWEVGYITTGTTQLILRVQVSVVSHKH